MKNYLKIFHNFCQQNRFFIWAYSFIQYHERFNRLKQIPRDLKMRVAHFIIQGDNQTTFFFLPYYKTDYIQREIYRTKTYYEISYLKKIFFEWNRGIIGQQVKDNVVLDVGANIGNHTLFFLKEAGAFKVFCFEPVKDTFDILKKNIDINNLTKKVCLQNIGIGETKGNASIKHYDPSNIGGTSLSINGNGSIPITSIDSLDIQDSIILMKIDVEGLELSVIKGAKQTIKKFHPYIMIEIRNVNYEEIDHIFHEMGYAGECFFKNWEYGDYLFHPSNMNEL